MHEAADMKALLMGLVRQAFGVTSALAFVRVVVKSQCSCQLWAMSHDKQKRLHGLQPISGLVYVTVQDD